MGSQFNTQLWGQVLPGGAGTPGVAPVIVPGPRLQVADIVYTGYRIAGILEAAGRNASATEQGEGLNVLNSLIDSWRTQRLLVWAVGRNEYPVITGKDPYRIALTGGDIPLERPERLEAAGYVLTGSTPAVEIPLQLLNLQEWEALSPKGLKSTIATMAYYDAQVPSGLLHLWPIPTTNSDRLALYCWQVLSLFGSLDDAVIVPPGYQRAMEYALAIELAVRFPRRAKLAPGTAELAAKALGMIKSLNTPKMLMRTEGACGSLTQRSGHWNIYTHSWM